MKHYKLWFFAACMLFASTGFAQAKKPRGKSKAVIAQAPPVRADTAHFVQMDTDLGSMTLMLYDSTPLYRANFLDLVRKGFYDSLLFHRVITGFMVQTGDPDSRHARPGIELGSGGANIPLVPAEFVPSYFHKRGALGVARENNPTKAGSGCQFYIVDGKTYTDADLDGIQAKKGIVIPPDHREVYKARGGAPFLDQNYTVFGEVVSGLDVISKIANVPRDARNRPITDVHLKMHVLEQSRGK